MLKIRYFLYGFN